jgi:hypothetical protein
MQVATMMFRLSIFLSTAQLIFLQNDAFALSFGWRVALNIGREPTTTKSPSWASSGARLPFVIKCDFLQNGQVVPKEDVIRFTGPDGEVVNKIEKGEWSLKDERELEFSFTFPEELSRRDVTLGPCTVKCKGGLLYSKDALKDMNDVFYRSREESWKAGELVNDIARRKEAPKKWDEESQQWVKRYTKEGLLSQVSKRVQLFAVKQKERTGNSKRPNPKDLSLDSGPFPGVESDVFIKKVGILTAKEGLRDVVVGTWSAEPINFKPKSYYY